MKMLPDRFSLNATEHALWKQREIDLPYFKRLLLRAAKVILIAGRHPFNRKIGLYATSLSFTFLLSIIPMLAMVFAIAKGFGIQDKVQPLLLDKMVGGEIASDLVPKIVEYVNNTNVKALGYIGLIFIVYTAITMLGQIEASFNTIWNIRNPRSIIRKFSDYLSILIISPILLAVTLGMSTTLQSHAFTQKLLEIGLFAGAMKIFLHLVPWLSSILVLTLAYMIIPNTRVHLLPALAAGMLTGCAWQLSQIIFIKFQVGVAKYNAIYGTFATLPIFMIWLQVTWMIVLFGAVFNHACQHVRRFHPLDFEKELHFGSLEKLDLAVLLLICRRFEQAKPAPGPSDISRTLGISRGLVTKAIGQLLSIGYIVAVAGQSGEGYVPSRTPSRLQLAHFFRDVKGKDSYPLEVKDERILAAVDEIMATYAESLDERFGSRGLDGAGDDSR